MKRLARWEARTEMARHVARTSVSRRTTYSRYVGRVDATVGLRWRISAAAALLHRFGRDKLDLLLWLPLDRKGVTALLVSHTGVHIGSRGPPTAISWISIGRIEDPGAQAVFQQI